MLYILTSFIYSGGGGVKYFKTAKCREVKKDKTGSMTNQTTIPKEFNCSSDGRPSGLCCTVDRS